MELVVACRRHHYGCAVRGGVRVDDVRGQEPMGKGRGVSLPVWHVGELCGIDGIPCAAHLRAATRPGTGGTAVEMEGAAAQMGPCSDILAYRGVVFAADAGGTAHAGLLGVVAVLVCVAVCHSGNHRQLCPSEGAF